MTASGRPPRTGQSSSKDDTRVEPTVSAAGPLAPADGEAPPAVAPSSQTEVADFLAKVRTMTPVTGAGRGRLVFAMDATMSREPTWDLALGLQADMFHAVKEVGTLDVQLVYFRGAGECRASKWVSDADRLARLMTQVTCQGGYTQICKVLAHARAECAANRVNALVYVGDCMEEDIDELSHRAGELALLGVPVFLFQEGRDSKAERAFREIARLTSGAHCRFDAGSARQLRELLTAVAVYAAGGRKALKALASTGAGRGATLLLEQMSGKGR